MSLWFKQYRYKYWDVKHLLALTHEEFSDQYQYLGNCPPTPPLTQQQSIDNNLGLMLG